MPHETDPADLAALEQLIHYGLAELVTIDGEPHYLLAVHDISATAPTSSV